MLKDSKDDVKKWFFNLDDFRKWEQANKNSKLKVIYLKGLGSLESKDLDYIISQQGFESLLEEYFLDEESAKYIDDWLGSNSEPRKKYIKDFKLDINRI